MIVYIIIGLICFTILFRILYLKSLRKKLLKVESGKKKILDESNKELDLIEKTLHDSLILKSKNYARNLALDDAYNNCNDVLKINTSINFDNTKYKDIHKKMMDIGFKFSHLEIPDFINLKQENMDHYNNRSVIKYEKINSHDVIIATPNGVRTSKHDYYLRNIYSNRR